MLSTYLFSIGILPPNSFNGDVFFIVDSSGSVSKKNYQLEKEFVKSVAKEFNVAPGKSRAAFLTYGSFPWLVKRFESHSLPGEFESVVDRTSAIGGPRRIDKTLEVSAREFLNARPKIPKIAIIMTGGKQVADLLVEPLNSAIQPLRRLGVKTYVVAIGNTSDVRELNALVERPQDIFLQKSFSTLRPKDIVKKIINKHCKYLLTIFKVNTISRISNYWRKLKSGQNNYSSS